MWNGKTEWNSSESAKHCRATTLNGTFRYGGPAFPSPFACECSNHGDTSAVRTVILGRQDLSLEACFANMSGVWRDRTNLYVQNLAKDLPRNSPRSIINACS